MKLRKKYLIFLFFSLINGLIFLFRDHFAYHRFANTTALYSTPGKNWKKFPKDYPKEELSEASKIIDSNIHLANLSVQQQVLAIGNFLYNRFAHQIGRPSEKTIAATPLADYKLHIANDTLKLWCGNFANMFAYFCWSKGITCRVIEIMNPGDHHVFNECYLPESNQWMLVDITFNHLQITNSAKSGIENFQSLKNVKHDTLMVFRAGDPSIQKERFDNDFYDRYLKNGPPVYYYYRTNLAEIYKPLEKIKRYFLPVAWFEEMNSHKKNNLLFYLKEFFILLWILSVFSLIVNRRKLTTS